MYKRGDKFVVIKNVGQYKQGQSFEFNSLRDAYNGCQFCGIYMNIPQHWIEYEGQHSRPAICIKATSMFPNSHMPTWF